MNEWVNRISWPTIHTRKCIGHSLCSLGPLTNPKRMNWARMHNLREFMHTNKYITEVNVHDVLYEYDSYATCESKRAIDNNRLFGIICSEINQHYDHHNHRNSVVARIRVRLHRWFFAFAFFRYQFRMMINVHEFYPGHKFNYYEI